MTNTKKEMEAVYKKVFEEESSENQKIMIMIAVLVIQAVRTKLKNNNLTSEDDKQC